MTKREEELMYVQQLLDFVKNGGTIQVCPPQKTRREKRYEPNVNLVVAKRKS